MSQVVRHYYNEHVEHEWERLDLPFCKVEFLSILRLIEKYFPPSGHVCDIGSGPGRYALALAQRGYRVTLFDLSEHLLARARAAFKERHLRAEQFDCGDARDMGVFKTKAFDAALLLRPLYHVLTVEGRADILRHLKRVLNQVVWRSLPT